MSGQVLTALIAALALWGGFPSSGNCTDREGSSPSVDGATILYSQLVELTALRGQHLTVETVSAIFNITLHPKDADPLNRGAIINASPIDAGHAFELSLVEYPKRRVTAIFHFPQYLHHSPDYYGPEICVSADALAAQIRGQGWTQTSHSLARGFPIADFYSLGKAELRIGYTQRLNCVVDVDESLDVSAPNPGP